MSERVTIKELGALVDILNDDAKLPREPYSTDERGVFKPNAGVYHLYQAYGGYALERMSMNEGCTGTTRVFGLDTKKDLARQIRAYLNGIAVTR